MLIEWLDLKEKWCYILKEKESENLTIRKYRDDLTEKKIIKR